MNPLANVPVDKQGHFIVGILIYATLHFVNPTVGMVAVIAAAFAKEGYDYLHRDRHTPDVWDTVATVLGGVVGFICSL